MSDLLNAPVATATAPNVNALVELIPNKTTGLIVSPFKLKPERGFLNLRFETEIARGTWLEPVIKTTLFKGKVDKLQRFVNKYAVTMPHPETGLPAQFLPGIIRVREFVQDEIPQEYHKLLKHDTLPASEMLQQFLKTTGTDRQTGQKGIPLMKDGKYIYRFSEYIMLPTEGDVDILVQHDNQAQVKAHRSSIEQARIQAAAAAHQQSLAQQPPVAPQPPAQAPDPALAMAPQPQPAQGTPAPATL
jgi:hypothetical protein